MLPSFLLSVLLRFFLPSQLDLQTSFTSQNPSHICIVSSSLPLYADHSLSLDIKFPSLPACLPFTCGRDPNKMSINFTGLLVINHAEILKIGFLLFVIRKWHTYLDIGMSEWFSTTLIQQSASSSSRSRLVFSLIYIQSSQKREII